MAATLSRVAAATRGGRSFGGGGPATLNEHRRLWRPGGYPSKELRLGKECPARKDLRICWAKRETLRLHVHKFVMNSR